MCLLCRLVPSFLLRLLMTDKLQAFFILPRCGCDRHRIWEMTIWVAHLSLFWIATSPWNLIKMHTWFQMCIRVRWSSCSYGLHCGLSNWRICGSEHCVVDSREKNNTIGLPRKMVVMQFCNMTTIVDTECNPMIITIHFYIRWIFENSWSTLCPNHIIKNLTKFSKKKTLMVILCW